MNFPTTQVEFSSVGAVYSSVSGPQIPKNAVAAAPAPKGIKTPKGNQKDAEKPEESQSFFRKYWYIILPVVLMTLLGGEAPAEGGAAGAGAGAGAGSARRK